MIKDKNKEINFIWYAIIIIFFIVFLVHLAISGGSAVKNVVFNGGTNIFMDFFNPIAYVSGGEPFVKGMWACYPAFVFDFYFAISKIISVPAVITGHAVKASVGGMNALWFYFISTLLVFSLAVFFLKKGSLLTRALFIVLIIFSNPFLFQFERMNNIFAANIFVLLFFIFKESDRKWVFEIGLFCLAAAAAIKIYPALLMLLLIKDKKWYAAVRCSVYSLALFLLPFLHYGGISAFKMFVNNLSLLSEYGKNAINPYGLNLSNLLHVIFGGFYGVVTYRALSFIFFAFGIFSFFFHKVYWKKAGLLCCLMIIFPAWSGQYTAIFMLMPLILFIDEKNKKNEDAKYAVLFAGIFSVFSFKNLSSYMANSVIVETVSILLLALLLIYEGISNFMEIYKGKSVKEFFYSVRNSLLSKER